MVVVVGWGWVGLGGVEGLEGSAGCSVAWAYFLGARDKIGMVTGLPTF